MSETKTTERHRARELRGVEGRSIKEIAALLAVSPASVSRWVRDVELTPAQIVVLADRNPALNAQRNGARTRARRARAERLRAQEEGRRAARRGDPLHAAGCMLYWAEGSKSRNHAQFTNSDPAMVAFFLRFLRATFDVPLERVRIQCNLHADDDAERLRVEAFWISELGLASASLTKSMVNRVSRSSRGRRVGMLPNGTCRLTVNSTWIVQHLYGAIQEYGGFERPDWLDLAA